jgi:hypothetical protein
MQGINSFLKEKIEPSEVSAAAIVLKHELSTI